MAILTTSGKYNFTMGTGSNYGTSLKNALSKLVDLGALSLISASSDTSTVYTATYNWLGDSNLPFYVKFSNSAATMTVTIMKRSDNSTLNTFSGNITATTTGSAWVSVTQDANGNYAFISISFTSGPKCNQLLVFKVGSGNELDDFRIGFGTLTSGTEISPSTLQAAMVYRIGSGTMYYMPYFPQWINYKDKIPQGEAVAIKLPYVESYAFSPEINGIGTLYLVSDCPSGLGQLFSIDGETFEVFNPYNGDAKAIYAVKATE